MQGFISHHSFIPDEYLCMSNNFLSVNEEGIWAHNKECDYQTYYNKFEPFEIGYTINNQLVPNVLQSLSIYSEWIEWKDKCPIYVKNKFFDQLFIYNDCSSTGLVDLYLKDNNETCPDKGVEVSNIEGCTYRMNQFCNQQTLQPFFCLNKALNVPLYTAAGYGNGLQIGNSLGFNEKSQKDLAKISAINSGLNSIATLNQTARQQREEREKRAELYDEQFQRVSQDNYRYNYTTNSPYNSSYFKKGGEVRNNSTGHTYKDKQTLTQKLRHSIKKYQRGGQTDIILNQGRHINHSGSNFPATSRLNDEYHPVNYQAKSSSYGFADIHGTRLPSQVRQGTGYYQSGGQVPVSNNGLYEYPNQPVIVPSNRITMQGINHNALAVPNNDKPRVMKPNREYKFKNSNRILEIPIL